MIVTIDNQFNIVYMTQFFVSLCALLISALNHRKTFTPAKSCFSDALERLKNEGNLVRTFPEIREDHLLPTRKVNGISPDGVDKRLLRFAHDLGHLKPKSD